MHLFKKYLFNLSIKLYNRYNVSLCISPSFLTYCNYY